MGQFGLNGFELFQQLIHLVQQFLGVARRSLFSVQRADWVWRDLRWRGAEGARAEAFVVVKEVGNVWKRQWLLARRLELRRRWGDSLGRRRGCGCSLGRGRGGGVAC